MPSGEWFLGVDLGTSSVKAAAVDILGKPVAFSSRPYLTDSGKHQWGEQDIELIFQAMVGSIHDLAGVHNLNLSACRALSIGCALHGVMAVNEVFEPLTGLMSWTDNRAMDIATAVRNTGQWMDQYRRTGCPPHGMYPLYKIAWLKEHAPEVYSKACCFLSAKAYILQRLTGELLVDFAVASGSGYMDLANKQWDNRSLDFAGISISQIPQLVSPWEVLPGLTEESARITGLPRAIKIVLGVSDAVNSNIGAGCMKSGQFTCMIGSSGAIRHITKSITLDPQARTWCYCVDDSHFLVGGAINNGGIVMNWIAENLLGYRLPAENRSIPVSDLEILTKGIPAGADGLVFLPFLAGERSPGWNQSARGALFGLSMEHNAGHVIRAAMEGVAFRMKSVLDVLIEQGGEVLELRASGGYVNSSLWSMIVASVLNREILVTRWPDTSAVGAGLIALHGHQPGACLGDISTRIPVEKTVVPEKAWLETYERHYGVFCGCKPAVDQFPDPNNRTGDE